MVQFVDASDSGIDHVVAAVQRADALPGFDASVTGQKTIDRDFNTLSESDLQHGELRFGLPAALIVLLLVFGAVVAGLMPLLIALPSIVVALGLVALLAQAFDLSIFIVNMLTGMGLALGIDYSLFVVSRFREERGRGREQMDAIAATGDDGEPRRRLQRHDLRDRDVRDADRPQLDHAQPRRRRDRRRRVSVVASRDAAAGAARADRRRRRPAAHPVLRPALAEQSQPGGPLLARDRPRASCAGPGSAWRWRSPCCSPRRRRSSACTSATSGVTALPDRFESVQGYVALQRDFPRERPEPRRDRRRRGATEPATRAALARLGRSSRPTRASGRARSRSQDGDASPRSPCRSAATRPATAAVAAVRDLRCARHPGRVRRHRRRRCSSAARRRRTSTTSTR